MRGAAALGATMAFVLLALAAAPGPALAGPPIIKATDKCTPFVPPEPYRSEPGSYAKHLDTLSNSQLADIYYNLPAPTEGQGFPLAGCTIGWVPGKGIGAQVARLPGLNMGWSGKCFSFNYNATTGTPTSLLNEFSPQFENFKIPQRTRAEGKLEGEADVYWTPTSLDPRTKGAVWKFNYKTASPIWNPNMKSNVQVNSIRDEVRQVRPGELMGRMYIKTSDGSADKVPIYFSLFQACTSDYKYPLTPGARQLPRFGPQ